jgi:hypothetical protein
MDFELGIPEILNEWALKQKLLVILFSDWIGIGWILGMFK